MLRISTLRSNPCGGCDQLYLQIHRQTGQLKKIELPMVRSNNGSWQTTSPSSSSIYGKIVICFSNETLCNLNLQNVVKPVGQKSRECSWIVCFRCECLPFLLLFGYQTHQSMSGDYSILYLFPLDNNTREMFRQQLLEAS